MIVKTDGAFAALFICTCVFGYTLGARSDVVILKTKFKCDIL